MMFRWLYWAVLVALLFRYPGASIIMFGLWLIKVLFASVFDSGQPRATPVPNGVGEATSAPVISPEAGQQAAVEFAEQAAELEREREEDELLAANHANEAIDFVAPSDESWQSRLEDGYRP